MRRCRWLLIAGLAVASPEKPSRRDSLRTAYERSAAACRHGHSGRVIVTVHEAAHPADYLEKLRARQRSGDELMQHFTKVGRYVAAKLTRCAAARPIDLSLFVLSV